MAYSALQLITRSYYLSQIVARELQTVSAAQLTDGLYLLNAILDFKSTDTRHIPYYRLYEFDAVINQEEYFVPGLLNVDTLTFNIGQVRYSMNELTRTQYFGLSRVDGIQGLPFCYRIERELGGSRIYMYFVPDSVYEMKLHGKFALSDVILSTDMSLVYDTYYLEYLRYALAEYICCEYGSTFPDESKSKYKELQKKIIAVSPPDLSLQNENYFGGGFGIDWQTANLSKGWWPF